MNVFKVKDVVQFNEEHKWCGCLGIIDEIKEYEDGTIRYMIGVPIPRNDGEKTSTAYIFVSSAENALEYIGTAALV